MPFLKRAARFRAHAVACLAAAEAAGEAVTRRAHLAMAKHFYALAEQELSEREARRRASVSSSSNQTRHLAERAA